MGLHHKHCKGQNVCHDAATSITMVLGSAPNNSRSCKSGRKPGCKAEHKHPRLSGIVLANQSHRLRFGLNGTSSSLSVGHSFSTNSFGRRSLCQEVLHATAIQVRQDHDHVDYQHHHDSTSIDEHSQLAHIQADDDDFLEQEAGMDMISSQVILHQTLAILAVNLRSFLLLKMVI